MPTPYEPIVRDYRLRSFPCSMRDSEYCVPNDCFEHVGPPGRLLQML